MSREPTRQQLSSKLAYEHKTPAFLLKLQRKVAGRGGRDSEEEDEDGDAEFEDDGSGRPPIPRRPAIPQRPDDDPGSADEDADEEKPQVVVLKEGKHLSEREAENEKRKAMGLPPLVDPVQASSSDVKDTSSGKKKTNEGLIFSSGGKTMSKNKRKIEDASEKTKPTKKKVKKSDKKLLSFGDEA